MPTRKWLQSASVFACIRWHSYKKHPQPHCFVEKMAARHPRSVELRKQRDLRACNIVAFDDNIRYTPCAGDRLPSPSRRADRRRADVANRPPEVEILLTRVRFVAIPKEMTMASVMTAEADHLTGR